MKIWKNLTSQEDPEKSKKKMLELRESQIFTIPRLFVSKRIKSLSSILFSINSFKNFKSCMRVICS